MVKIVHLHTGNKFRIQQDLYAKENFSCENKFCQFFTQVLHNPDEAYMCQVF